MNRFDGKQLSWEAARDYFGPTSARRDLVRLAFLFYMRHYGEDALRRSTYAMQVLG